MSTLALGLLIVCAVATAVFFIAGGLYAQGSPWARDVCSLSQDLCDHPAWSLVVTAVVAGLYLVLRGRRY
jgi:hypothetical protein